MSDTANHRVEMHRLAVARRAAGKPIWAETIDLKDIFNQDSMMFEDRRDSIVGQIRLSRWYKDSEECSELRECVDGISQSEDEEEFDQYWDELYDMADYGRVWINTR